MFKIVKDMEQGSQEWLDLRRKYVTATDAMKILGVCPPQWGSALTCWQDKITGKTTKMNPAMQRGIDLEPFALTAYNQIKGYDCEPAILVSTVFTFAMASLDGISKDHKHLVEIKCPGKKTHDIAKSGKVPEYYFPQLQHQMLVANVKSMDYCSYDGIECIIIPVARDDDFINEMIAKEMEFYACLINMVEPESSEIHYEEIFDPKILASSDRLHNAKLKMRELNGVVEEEKAYLAMKADGRNIKVGEMKITKRFRKGSINYKDIPEIQKLDVEKYRSKSSEYYQFN